jgi:acyl-CoA thioester hydrolase
VRKLFEVRWDDVDVNGHTHSTKYLEYATHMRFAYMQGAGWDMQKMVESGIAVVLLGEEVEYRKETFLGQVLTVTFQITGMSADGARWQSQHDVLRPDGRVAATIRSRGAWISLASRKIQAPPPELAAAFEPLCSNDLIVIGS